MTAWLLLTALAAEPSFPERTPAMIESCLYEAAALNEVSQNDEEHKYICGEQAAQELWNYLEQEKIESYEQTVEDDIWLTREFPLGGCFKRIRRADGTAAPDGLSCTIWIPRPVEIKR